MRTFVIAECCSSWRFGPIEQHLQNAYRMILAAKECDADAAKFQWTSDVEEMARRRNDTNPANYEILAYPIEWLHKLKAKCDEVGIEFMCTVFIERDIATIAPFVSRFKVASAESSDGRFIAAHGGYKKETLVSYAFGSAPQQDCWYPNVKHLHCVCSYPTPIDQLNLNRLRNNNFSDRPEHLIQWFDGISDHTTSTLTGALAVACGATIIEKHIKLYETPKDNPDFPHSIHVGYSGDYQEQAESFSKYVSNIREAEKAMGSGENVEMPCEVVNRGRRVRI